MNSKNFNADDIHALRVETAEKYRNISKEEAEVDFKFHLDNVKKTMSDIQRKKKETA